MKHLMLALGLLIATSAYAEKTKITVNDVTYTCSKSISPGVETATCACRKKDASGASYSVFYYNGEEWSDIGRSRYSNVGECARAMNGTDEFKNICN